MKILHSSDWHLGHVLYDFDRTEEQLSMMQQVGQIIADEKPDAFIISGDLFHTSAPSAFIQRLFAEWLIRLHLDNPSMQIVVTAGNHDSQSRHEIFRSLWDVVGVHMIGSLDGERPENHIVELPLKGFIIAVPYANERYIPEGFFVELQRLTAERNPDGRPVVMMAHSTVAGCDFSAHRDGNERNVGGIDSVPLASFGDDYDYLALGHIHRPQNLSPRARYCGTPISISFDEQFQHGVTMVEIDKHGSLPTLRFIPIAELRPLVTLPKKGAAGFDDALLLLRNFPNDSKAYIRLNVCVETFLPPNANVLANDAAKGKECRFCLINALRKAQNQTSNHSLTVSELQQIAPSNLARRYASEKGLPFDEELFNFVVDSI